MQAVDQGLIRAGVVMRISHLVPLPFPRGRALPSRVYLYGKGIGLGPRYAGEHGQGETIRIYV